MQASIERAISEAQTLEDLAEHLAFLLDGGFSVWSDGTLLRTRVRVDAIAGVTMTINPKEHAPPHFHIRSSRTDASLQIHDGSVLSGHVDPRDAKIIAWWFDRAKPNLVRVWNETRPSDCPVGTIEQ